MPSLDALLIVVAVAFAAPFLLGLAPGLRIPAVVLEIVAGIAVGPSGFGWVEVDATIEVMATHRARVPAVPGRARGRLRPAARPRAAA